MKILKLVTDPSGFDRELDSRGRYLGSFTKLNKEYVVLENNSLFLKDISGWSVEDLKGHKFKFPEETLIQPEQALTLYSGSGKRTARKIYWGRKAPVWNNEQDTAILRDENGKIIDKKVQKEGIGSQDIEIINWVVPKWEYYDTKYIVKVQFRNRVPIENFTSTLYTQADGEIWNKEDTRDESRRVSGSWTEEYQIKGKTWNWYDRDVKGVHVVKPKQDIKYKVEYRRLHGNYITKYCSESTEIRITQEMLDHAWWNSGGTVMVEVGGVIMTVAAFIAIYSAWTGVGLGVATVVGAIGAAIAGIGAIIWGLNPLD